MSEQLTKDGFEKVWLKVVREGNGFMRAYDIVEGMHIEKYGSQRYSDYKSFARSRDYKPKRCE